MWIGLPIFASQNVSNMTTTNFIPSILIIYTGGTIGMIENPATGVLEAFSLRSLMESVPELKRFGYEISTTQFEPPIDSSEMEPLHWSRLVKLIADNYDQYDGFVVLHGTDTMSFTASALSFMLEDLCKPIILTGSQLPIGKLRTDGRENLITSIEIAAAKKNHKATVSEVCIFFESHLMRGNRTSKVNADRFNAFRSFNYPVLARAGVQIKYDATKIRSHGQTLRLKPHYTLDQNVVVLKLFPGISQQIVESILSIPSLKGVVIETYGSGNAPGKEWFIDKIKQAIDRGLVIVNVTQCQIGRVQMKRYGSGHRLQEIGVVSGYDITTEAAITKLMYLFGRGYSADTVIEKMKMSIAGEITTDFSYDD